MMSSRRVMWQAAVFAWIGCALGLATGCDQTPPEQAAPKVSQGAPKRPNQPPASNTHPRSIFAGTPMEVQPPVCLAMNRTGTEIAFKVADQRSGQIYIRGLALEDGKSKAGRDYIRNDGLIQDALAIHPSKVECLAVSVAQVEGGPVADIIWRLHTETQRDVPYLSADGMRLDFNAAEFADLEPFYSWDGNVVLIPLRTKGIVVIEQLTGINKLIPYPEFDGEITGMASGSLPDYGEHRRIYVSLWEGATGPEEHSEISILDLDSLEWVRTARVAWPVYQVAAANLDVEPWLVCGSRQSRGAERTRVHLIALLDPDTEAISLLPIGGDPIWRSIVLEPNATKVAYMDSIRKALVRIDLQTDLLEIDPGYYSEEAKLFICEGGDPVYAWDGPDLIKAEFSETDELLAAD